MLRNVGGKGDRTEDRCGSNGEFVAVLEVADDGAGVGTGCGVAIPAWLSGSPLREWPAKHKTCSDDREGWSHAAVLSKPERHFSIRDFAAFLGQAALLQSFLFSRCKLPARASDQRGNKGLFKLHRSRPLKLRRLFPYPAI